MNTLWTHLVPLTLGFVGGVLHRILTVRAEQLKLKTKILPEAVRSVVQEELQKVVPALAQQVQAWVDSNIQNVAKKLSGTSNSN